MKNNKGFISVSIIYSFFLVFIAIVIGMVAMYVNRRILINKIEDEIRDSFPNSCLSEGITILSECILFNNGGRGYIESQETPDFSVETSAEEYGLYASLDDYGTSYYFRGNVMDNYVQFGSYAAGAKINVLDSNRLWETEVTYSEETPIYWRIVRINGDGTIRLAYDGTTKNANGVPHIANVGKTSYNSDDYFNVNYGESDVKAVVDSWYNTHLKANYESYIADRIFCNDKELTNYTYSTDEYYAPYTRLVTNKMPKLTCERVEDRYTKTTERVNGQLTHPVGLLTADEVFLAGGTNTSNYTYYLYSRDSFWTASPYDFLYRTDIHIGYARVWLVTGGGNAGGSAVNVEFGARPVINLRADVKFTGSGTINDPFVIEVQ